LFPSTGLECIVLYRKYRTPREGDNSTRPLQRYYFSNGLLSIYGTNGVQYRTTIVPRLWYSVPVSGEQALDKLLANGAAALRSRLLGALFLSLEGNGRAWYGRWY